MTGLEVALLAVVGVLLLLLASSLATSRDDRRLIRQLRGDVERLEERWSTANDQAWKNRDRLRKALPLLTALLGTSTRGKQAKIAILSKADVEEFQDMRVYAHRNGMTGEIVLTLGPEDATENEGGFL